MASVMRGWVNVQQREEAAFDRLFSTEYAKVVAIARRVLGDAHEAEDVAQDVFYSYYRSHAPDSQYAAAWLYRAAAHTALNVVRGARRRRRREESDAVDRMRLQGHAEAGLDPQQALEDAERRAAVRRALGRLPEKSAAVLALRYSGLSYAEVGGALGVGTGQVGTLLRRAEDALRKEMNDGTPE